MPTSRVAMLLSALAAMLIVGCGPHQENSAPSSLLVDVAAAKTAYIYLTAGYNSNNLDANFDGYANGRLVITVPVGYRVVLNVTNDGGIPHDAGVYTVQNQLAFAGAGDSTTALEHNPSAGIMPGQSATFRFVADRIGSYRLADLLYSFPAHGRMHDSLGMWAAFRVARTGSPRVMAD